MGENYKSRKNLEEKIALDTSIAGFIEREEDSISARLANVLRQMSNAAQRNYHYLGIRTVRELISKKNRLYQMLNFGKKSLEELNSILSRYSLPKLDLDMKKKKHHLTGDYYRRRRYCFTVLFLLSGNI